MATKDCKSCTTLKETAPDFILNGVTDSVCTSLKNNTGLNTGNSNDNCTDLDLANDCLIGNMEPEVGAYEVCDWKGFMPKFIHNVWEMNKAMLCSMCGLWTNVKNLLNQITDLWKKVEEHDCEIKTLINGKSFSVGEDNNDGSYVVAGKGVSFLQDDASDALADVTLMYVAGGLLRLQGTLRFSTENFNDPRACYNFDTDGESPRHTASRRGNDVWNNTANVTIDGTRYHPVKVLPSNGELLFEIRIKKSEYPFIKNIYSGIAAPTGGGQYQINLVAYNEGSSALGQNADSPRHTVEPGYFYVQARMISIGYLNAGLDHHYSPRGFMGIRMNQDAIDCK